MRVQYEEMKQVFFQILTNRGLSSEDAQIAADNFATNSLEGVVSHGVNRFVAIISSIDKGIIDVKARAEVEQSFGAFERWNGCFAMGNVNASRCMTRATELAGGYGIGMVAIRNTNHWLRAGTWGIFAADRGYLGICWTNTPPNMAPWGIKEKKIGNNPIAICVPGKEGRHILFDGAMSQYSGGAVQKKAMDNSTLQFPAGYDSNGELSCNAAEVYNTGLMIPMGYWKGTALSIALDAAASVLAMGSTTHQLEPGFSNAGEKRGVSQVFIAVDVSRYGAEYTQRIVEETAQYINECDNGSGKLHFPGEGRIRAIEENLKLGIEVNDRVWDNIQDLF